MSRCNPEIPRRGRKPRLNFYGYDDSYFIETQEYFLKQSLSYDWSMVTGLSASNNWNNYFVDGATEYHLGFRYALMQIADKYPEIIDYWVSFDGPSIEILTLIQNPLTAIVLPTVEFLHGTSTELLDDIFDRGLCPRSITGLPPSYGASITRAMPCDPDAVYLTTQANMAGFAARDACQKHGGSAAILRIMGVDPNKAIPDVDSRESTAEMSLQRMGSIGYRGCISPDKIEMLD
jgi:hypothetical protein